MSAPSRPRLQTLVLLCCAALSALSARPVRADEQKSVAASAAEDAPTAGDGKRQPADPHRDARWAAAPETTFRSVAHYAVNLSVRGGGARAPFFSQAFPSVLGHGFVLQLGGAYRLSERMLLSVQMPLLLFEIAQPAGSFVNRLSWGNANFALARRSLLWRSARLRLFGIAGASIALPIAQWGPRGSLLGLRALQVANAMDGLRQQELYTAGALPLAGSYALLMERADFALEASLRVPIFVRFSRARLPREVLARRFASTPVLRFAARYTPVPWLDLTFAADTVFNGQAPVASARYARTTQPVLTPAVGFHVRGAWQLRAEFVLPVAGALGSHAYAGSLGLGFER